MNILNRVARFLAGLFRRLFKVPYKPPYNRAARRRRLKELKKIGSARLLQYFPGMPRQSRRRSAKLWAKMMLAKEEAKRAGKAR